MLVFFAIFLSWLLYHFFLCKFAYFRLSWIQDFSLVGMTLEFLDYALRMVSVLGAH